MKVVQKIVITVFTASSLLLAPVSALTQDTPDNPAAVVQEADLSREARIFVQRGLAFLGFDPGPADGLFGPKTRAAIWDWQAAKELDTTGYLTMPEAEALAALGMEAGETRDMQMRPSAGQPPVRSTVGNEPSSSGAQNQVLYFPAHLTCGTDDETPEGCWAKLSSPTGCFVWAWPSSERFSWLGKTFSWSGECNDDTSMAYGRGTLKPDWGDGEREFTGELVDGKRQGQWVLQRADGGVYKGPYVDGKRHGHWVLRDGDGYVREGPYIDGREHGHWVFRWADEVLDKWWVPGTVSEGPYVDGKRHGRWVDRFSNGWVQAGPYVDDKKHGRWTIKRPQGTFERFDEYRNDELVD